MLTHLSLFTGIGGLDLAAEWAGLTTVGQCEWKDYPTKILEKHWPDVPRWRDIRTLTKESFYEKTELRTVDVISGGFPCQPFSVAGKRRGKDDDRYLWPEMCRVIKELKPTWVIGENVAGLVSMAEPAGESKMESRTTSRFAGEDHYEAVSVQREQMLLNGILKDLCDIGYEIQPFIIPACGVEAPHRRERLFIVAHARSVRRATRIDNWEKRHISDNGERESAQSQSARDGWLNRTWEARAIVENSGCTLQQRGILGKPYESKDGKRLTDITERPNSTSKLNVANSKSEQGATHINGENRDAQQGEFGGGCCERDVLSNSDNTAPARFGEHGGEIYGDTESERFNPCSGAEWWAVEPDVGRVAHGIPSRVDRLTCLGNAVVPYQALPIFQAIAKIERGERDDL